MNLPTALTIITKLTKHSMAANMALIYAIEDIKEYKKTNPHKALNMLLVTIAEITEAQAALQEETIAAFMEHEQ